MNIEQLIGNKAEQDEGVWIPFPEQDGVEFQLAYMEGKPANDFFVKRLSAARRRNRRADTDPTVMQEINRETMIAKVVKGWKGLEKDGKPFEYSLENCRWLIENSVPIRNFVSTESSDPKNFGMLQDAGKEDASKEAIKSGAAVGA